MLLNDQQLVDKARETFEVWGQVAERLEILVNEAKKATVLAAESEEELEELDQDRRLLIADLNTMVSFLLQSGVGFERLRKNLKSPYAQKALAREAF